eukprot:scaffold197443_cov18-Tisochrysis_lutea.AAC.1
MRALVGAANLCMTLDETWDEESSRQRWQDVSPAPVWYSVVVKKDCDVLSLLRPDHCRLHTHARTHTHLHSITLHLDALLREGPAFARFEADALLAQSSTGAADVRASSHEETELIRSSSGAADAHASSHEEIELIHSSTGAADVHASSHEEIELAHSTTGAADAHASTRKELTCSSTGTADEHPNSCKDKDVYNILSSKTPAAHAAAACLANLPTIRTVHTTPGATAMHNALQQEPRNCEAHALHQLAPLAGVAAHTASATLHSTAPGAHRDERRSGQQYKQAQTSEGLQVLLPQQQDPHLTPSGG